MSRTDPATIFAALGDPTRLKLLMTLSDGRTRSIASLSMGGPLTRQAIAKHLQVLEKIGLVRSEKAGRERAYVLRPNRLAEARSYLETVSAHWDDALARLKAHVEGKS